MQEDNYNAGLLTWIRYGWTAYKQQTVVIYLYVDVMPEPDAESCHLLTLLFSYPTCTFNCSAYFLFISCLEQRKQTLSNSVWITFKLILYVTPIFRPFVWEKYHPKKKVTVSRRNQALKWKQKQKTKEMMIHEKEREMVTRTTKVLSGAAGGAQLVVVVGFC